MVWVVTPELKVRVPLGLMLALLPLEKSLPLLVVT